MSSTMGGLGISPLAASALLGIPPAPGYLLHPESMEIIELDATGFLFWQVLKRTDSYASALAELSDQLDVERTELEQHLATFVHALKQLGLTCTPGSDELSVDQANGTPTRLTAIVAAHNRRDHTVRCLTSLFRQVPTGCALSAVVVDDGSTDGTAAAIAELNLPITVVPGPGDWFWSQSMAQAELAAEKSDPDLILWLNDDVDLDPHALQRALLAHRSAPDSILIGALWSVSLGDVSYSAMRSHGSTRPGFHVVAPSRKLQKVDAFHGNFVLVPRAVRHQLGPIRGDWPHNYADLDYASRASQQQIPMLLLPGLFGVCEPGLSPWHDPGKAWATRVRAFFGRKGWPPAAQLRLARAHPDLSNLGTELAMNLQVLTGSSVHRPPSRRILHPSLAPATEPRGNPGCEADSVTRFEPSLATDLIRLGPAADGGYVVSRSAVLASTCLISGGLGRNWQFEQAFRHMQSVDVYVFDGTMGMNFWVNHYISLLTQSWRARHLPTRADLRSLFDYCTFFNQADVRPIHRNLTAVAHGSASLWQVLADATDGEVFVKLDIEGGEYQLMGTLLAYKERITSLVIEFHLVGENLNRIERFIDLFDSHVLTFVRANNAGGMDDQGLPRLLELTWTRKDLYHEGVPSNTDLEFQKVSWAAPIAYSSAVRAILRT